MARDALNQADDQLWAAIAEPSRRRVLDLLVRHGTATASALAAEVPFTRQAVIKHLLVLEEAGLVVRERHGREVRFHPDPSRLDDAARTMNLVARQWERRLGAIKKLAEATHEAAKGGGGR